MNISSLIGEWRQRSRARRELATLEPRELRDAGISPDQASWEVGRPFWQPLKGLSRMSAMVMSCASRCATPTTRMP